MPREGCRKEGSIHYYPLSLHPKCFLSLLAEGSGTFRHGRRLRGEQERHRLPTSYPRRPVINPSEQKWMKRPDRVPSRKYTGFISLERSFPFEEGSVFLSYNVCAPWAIHPQALLCLEPHRVRLPLCLWSLLLSNKHWVGSMCYVLCMDTVVRTQVRDDAGPQDHYESVGFRRTRA